MERRAERSTPRQAREQALSPHRRPPLPPSGPIARATVNALSRVPRGDSAVAPTGRPIAIPNLRRNVCPHFYITGARGAIPIQAPHLLKGLMRQGVNVSRCQLRGGVHLEQGYVADVCVSSRFNQCLFYEDELTRR